ncbi:serine/arginine repetitive matrix protein 1-like [Copidosoma floridanum]|uniref:serine/arginine repetitive matrix protein 1-like n=1 Tax=Copidosoma floridanum TaxID=29053 RepID=UPI0006C9E1A7|nr:serine/arginine repetitive matrix protein 1-like [Copidosoma floridanum]
MRPRIKGQSLRTASGRRFLSPDDALRDLHKYASQGAEIRWELHTSRTDVQATRCGCHGPRRPTTGDDQLLPGGTRPGERRDLRKHHSAEIDKWSLRQDAEHELRKHLSDDSCYVDGAGRGRLERKWTLQVPEVHENPRRRCTCPKPPPRTPSPEQPATPEPGLIDDQPPPPPPLVDYQQEEAKKPVGAVECGKRTLRRRWAQGKAHQSLPGDKQSSSKWLRGAGLEDGKSKSLKERPKYSVRRSISPDPDPRQILRLDSRLVRRLVSPEVALGKDAKWAPYEGCSPLPSVGMRKRDVKKLADIKWQEGSSREPSPQPDSPRDDFRNVTPTRLPPPATDAYGSTDDEEWRMRFLNQVSAFPIYQGAWREETPPPSPRPEPPVWSPLRQRSEEEEEEPPTPRKRSTFKIRSGRKKSSSSSSRVKAQPEERRRPQLQRSVAVTLDVPHMDASKRSLSEEVPSRRAHHVPRAKSEDASRHSYPGVLEVAGQPGQELREYVTTV